VIPVEKKKMSLVNHAEIDGVIELFTAAFHGRVDDCSRLLERKVDVNAVDQVRLLLGCCMEWDRRSLFLIGSMAVLLSSVLLSMDTNKS